MHLLLVFLAVTAGCGLQPVVYKPSPEPAKKAVPPERVKKAVPKPYRVGSVWYQPIAEAKGFRQRGIASWYGDKFHGKRTSSGEIYNMHDMTAAHKTLPLGTRVRVTNIGDDRFVDVRINDRGPFVRKRIIDLSYAAAKKLGIVGPGTGPVEVVVLRPPVMAVVTGEGETNQIPADYFTGDFTIQVGSFSNRENAEILKGRLEIDYENVFISTFKKGQETFYRVQVGHFTSLEKVTDFEQRLIEKGYPGAFAVAK